MPVTVNNKNNSNTTTSTSSTHNNKTPLTFSAVVHLPAKLVGKDKIPKLRGEIVKATGKKKVAAILVTLRHYIWVARNPWQFEGTRPDPQVLVGKIESTFWFVSKVQHRVLCPTFYEEEWLAEGVL